MSNYEHTREEVKNYIIARVPLVVIDTSERARAEKLLRSIAAELSIDISYYTDAKQVRSLSKPGVSVNVDRDPLPYVAGEFSHKRRATFALGDCRKTGEDSYYTRELLNTVYLAKESLGTLILITPDSIWPRLARFGMLVRLDLPDLQERKQQIAAFVKDHKSRFRIEWTEPDIEYAAAVLSGFSEVQVNNILSSTLVEHEGLQRRDLSNLANQKSRLYAAVPSIHPVQVSEDLTVSGLCRLKEWLEDKRKIFFAPEETLRARDLEPPRAILLLGVPGCGKSLSAKMVASVWRLPLFRFDLGTVYDKYVGESEKKMNDALQFLDNVSPCVVWVDEIEKALSVSDGGNDVGRRVLGQFLFWMQESRSRVFLVATANDIASLPPELFRKGRFSELFFVDLPNRSERREVLCQYCGKTLHWIPEPRELDELAGICEGFSYADIEYAVKGLAERLLLDPDTRVDADTLAECFDKQIPYSKTNAETLRALRAWGADRAIHASGSQEVHST